MTLEEQDRFNKRKYALKKIKLLKVIKNQYVVENKQKYGWIQDHTLLFRN